VQGKGTDVGLEAAVAVWAYVPVPGSNSLGSEEVKRSGIADSVFGEDYCGRGFVSKR
jgi:hypothetical protein